MSCHYRGFEEGLIRVSQNTMQKCLIPWLALLALLLQIAIPVVHETVEASEANCAYGPVSEGQQLSRLHLDCMSHHHDPLACNTCQFSRHERSVLPTLTRAADVARCLFGTLFFSNSQPRVFARHFQASPRGPPSAI